MKKFVLLGSLLFLLLNVLAVYAQDEESFENPTYTKKFIEQQERLLENLDTLFPRFLVKETYDYASPPEVVQEDGFSFSSENKSGRRELTVTAYRISDSEEYNLGWDLFNRTGSYENFYLHIDVQLIDQDESNSGWCWFQYSNGSIVGESNRCSGEIIFPDKIESYKTKPFKEEHHESLTTSEGQI